MKQRRWIALLLVFMTIIMIPLASVAEAKVDANKKVKISQKELVLEIGEKVKLKITGTKDKVKWSSSDKKVATVSSSGRVTGKSEGLATIKAKVNGKTYKCQVTVVADNDIYENVELRIVHAGAYVARFTVTWNEITGYDSEGKPILEPHAWNQNGESVSAHFEAVVLIPATAQNLYVKAEGATGLRWDPWHRIIEQSDVSLSQVMKLRTWGQPLNQCGELK